MQQAVSACVCGPWDKIHSCARVRPDMAQQAYIRLLKGSSSPECWFILMACFNNCSSNSPDGASCSQFPPQTAASPDELKVYALWEAGDVYDQVKANVVMHLARQIASGWKVGVTAASSLLLAPSPSLESAVSNIRLLPAARKCLSCSSGNSSAGPW